MFYIPQALSASTQNNKELKDAMHWNKEAKKYTQNNKELKAFSPPHKYYCHNHKITKN